MTTNLMSAHKQWASRPADERYWSLADLQAELQAERPNHIEREVPLNKMQAVAVGDDVCVQGGKGNPAQLSNWAFGQLAMKANAPAGYLASLPAPMAASCLNHGLQSLEADEQGKLLLHRNGGWLVRAINTPMYGRIWNNDVIAGLMPALDMGWRTPPARPNVNDSRARPATAEDILPNQGNFGLSVREGDMIAPAGVYCGDRDMFVFLVNPERIIDDGNAGLMRGVFVWNSEVGGGAFKVKTFYLENVCGNHIVWGASGIKEIKIVHKKFSIRDYSRRMADTLKLYADMPCTAEMEMIHKARSIELAPTIQEVIERLTDMKSLLMSKKDIIGAMEYAVQWEHTARSAPTTVWAFAHGLTRYSQLQKYADERHKLDLAATKILTLAV